ncbi:MAG: 30S ribosomal protein S1 [Thermodesulfobacteriota bacterium]
MEDKPQLHNEEAETDFEKLFEGSVRQIRSGELVRGTVVQISGDAVIVDIGYKSEGNVPIDEFLDEEGKPSVSVGDPVAVVVEGMQDRDGYVVLSKKRAAQMEVWEDIVESCEKGTNLEGEIISRVKGGFHADIKGVVAFLPSSQVDLKPTRFPDKLIGERFEFRVLKYNKRKNNVIVSRRVILEKEREGLREKTLENLEEGAIVEGMVKNITDYGAFVDLGGIDGLVHLTDLSWGKVNHPSRILTVGDTINVKVLKFNKEEGKISLGLKQTLPDPWETAGEKYSPGSRVSGSVTNLTDYGAFVELEAGLEGLVHISEMSWTKLRHPSQKLKVGDRLEVMVLDVDPGARRISLGLKQIEPNPWDELEERYPAGSKVTGVVKNLTDFGMFVGVEEGVDGLVHISDLSWKKVKHPSDLFSKGQEVEATVLNVDKAAQKFSLSTKLLEKNPWDGVEERYKPGVIVEGTVTGIADFGAFVEMEEGLEGLVHVSDLNRGKKRGLEIGPGDLVEVEVLNVDPQEKKIGLSIRSIMKAMEKSEAPEETAPEAAPEEKAAVAEPTEETAPEEQSPEGETGEDEAGEEKAEGEKAGEEKPGEEKEG